MAYDYETEKQAIFTEEGQRKFLSIRDGVRRLVEKSGAVTGGKAMCAGSEGGDSWFMMACVERLVELGELREIPTPSDWAWQHKVFVAVG